MTAVDTNVLVRLLTEDDREQAAAARSLFEKASIWIAKTVLLETAWVLRSYTDLTRASFVRRSSNYLASTMSTEDEPSVAAALAFTAQGVDLADALHLSSRPSGVRFVSFDRSLVRRAKFAGAAEVSGLPAKGEPPTKILLESFESPCCILIHSDE